MSTPTPPGPAPELDRLNRALAAWRTPFAVLLVVLGVGCLVVSGYCFLRATAADPAAGPTEKDDTATPFDPAGKADTGLNRNRKEFYLGGVVGLAAALVGLGAGGWTLGRLPQLTAAGTSADTRRLAAVAGGGLGLLLMALGLGLFVLWFGTLVEWVDKRASPDAWKVITALLVFLLGGGLAFVSTQLLRVDERDNQTLRRIAFGTNTALSIILVLVALVAANVIVALKLPAKLDTTAAGFHTLHPDTAKLLADLPTGVTVYTALTEGVVYEDDKAVTAELKRTAADLQRLLDQCRATNPRRFEYKLLSLNLNKGEINKLKADHPEFNTPEAELGVLVVPEGKPGKLIPLSALLEANPQTGRRVFAGEAKLVGALLTITEDTDRTVYFLQGHGEIAVRPAGGDELGAGRTGTRLATALERVDAVVKPLTLELTAPKVPDDAAVVVIADPTAALPPEQWTALRTYLNAPRANKKKGKLVVLSGPHPHPNGKGVADTGLGAFLLEVGVLLGNDYLYAQPLSGREPAEVDAVPPPQGDHTITIQFSDRQIVFPNCRVVNLAQPGTGEYLFATVRGLNTWFEPDRAADPLATWKGMSNAADPKAAVELQTQRRVSTRQRPLAVVKHDGKVGQVVVYGSGDAFADPVGRGGEKYAANAELLAATVNWLRERPAAANIAGKEAGEYKADRALTGYNGLLLPVVGTLIATAALGLGVWVYRRK